MDDDYDEFALLVDNAREVGLPAPTATVRRTQVDTPSGSPISALVWGTEPAELVLVHGGAQNAHTWDTMALALGRPLVAIDLPGHGHSAWRPDRDYRPQAMAADVTAVVEALAPDAQALVGMSLGGLTALAASATTPSVADRLVLVDITPGVNQEKAAEIVSFVDGPPVFDSYEAMVERTVAFNPTRTESSLRRGVRHNARAQADGTWVWRYDQLGERLNDLATQFGDLWEAVSAVQVPLLLARGDRSPVVDDDDVAELLRRQPEARVEVVADAGHSIQGDQPLALAAVLDEFAS
jgi:pimeloyl-ACP methyl ester carboxylesterase